MIDSTRPQADNAVSRYPFRPVNPFRLAAIRAHAGHRILDAGCGNGAYVQRLRDEHDIHGLDISEFDSWAFDRERFREGTVTALPYADQSFDTVTSFEVLEHVEDFAGALTEFHRVTRQNIIVTVPNCQVSPGMEASRLTYFHYNDPTHCNFFTLDSFSNAVTDAGFSIVQKTLINPSDLTPLLKEAYGGPRVLWRFARRFLQRQSYRHTCLVVAERDRKGTSKPTSG